VTAPTRDFNDCRQLCRGGLDIERPSLFCARRGKRRREKKATREATEGLVGSYIHAGGKIGVLVEVNCESDFVARTEAFQHLCHDIAMHIAALDPKYVRREEVTPEMLETEREIIIARRRWRPATGTGGGENRHCKMEKFYEDNCLYEQHYIRMKEPRFARWWPAPVASWPKHILLLRGLAWTLANGPNRGSPGHRHYAHLY